MSDYLKEQQKLWKKLEETGFTEKQIDVLESFIEFHGEAVIDYLKDIEIDSLRTKLEQDIRTHRHLEDGEVTQPY